MGKEKKNKKSTAKKTAKRLPRSKIITVDLDKVANGYVISTFANDKSTKYIAKTRKEAMEYANKILGKK